MTFRRETCVMIMGRETCANESVCCDEPRGARGSQDRCRVRDRGTWSGLAVLCPSVWRSRLTLTRGLGLMLGAGPCRPSSG